ncbi:molybdenum cofactor cytidylyltransferase [Methylobacterium sp. BE186]|uniref:nucleotidyltransferase family protein n=1 Tax=Methylobacterium sp. BE186 TaxID=2817715 RepID=UPI00285B3768|nr:nucleotidyltransferase family protein [Methylobacterium sp. BE186]MDR7038480.1 molybdenum cofactor cytidylyltransferase [Methylobacterium sp. BE186]
MAEAVAALILAAGRGTRFGPEPKLLAELEGRPLVRHAAEAALASRLRPVVAVLGAHAEGVRAALRGLDLTCLRNPDYAEGLSTSLRAGLASLPAGIGAAVILLGDMPRVTGGDLDRLADAFAGAEPRPAAVIPVHAGRRGNPVLLNLRRLGPALAALRGDRGAGPLLAGRDDVLEIAGTAGMGFDVDTPEALRRTLGVTPSGSGRRS